MELTVSCRSGVSLVYSARMDQDNARVKRSASDAHLAGSVEVLGLNACSARKALARVPMLIRLNVCNVQLAKPLPKIWPSALPAQARTILAMVWHV